MGFLGSILVAPRRLLALPGAPFGSPDDPGGAFGGSLGAPGALPGTPWEQFWRSLGVLGRSGGASGHPREPQGTPGDDFGTIFDRLGSICGQICNKCWSLFGPIVATILVVIWGARRAEKSKLISSRFQVDFK